MSNREGMYYVGMIAGMILGVTLARMMGWHHLIGLVCGIAAGVPLGITSERLYVSMTKKPEKNQDLTVRCTRPGCEWTGNAGEHSNCPRCGQDLPIRI